MSNDKDTRSNTESAESSASPEASATSGTDPKPLTETGSTTEQAASAGEATDASTADSASSDDTKTPGKTGADKADKKETGKTQPSESARADQKPATDSGSGNNKAAGTASPSGPKRPKPWGLWLIIVVLILMLGGAGAAGWWGWQQWEAFNDDWQASQQTWDDERAALSDQVETLSSRLDERDGALDSLASDIENTRDELINLATQVNEQAALQDSDIQRLEIEYLLRTARHVSQLTGDLGQALTLLQQADRMLAEFDDLAYLPVREAIALDIQSLRDVPQPDVNGLYFELQALATRSRDWQWWPDSSAFGRADAPDDADDEDTSSPTDTWYQQLGRELRDLVTIRYRDGDATQRLSPQEFNQMQGQFRLLTQQAQVALLQRNQTLYNASLEQAIEWLESGAGQVPEALLIIDQLQRLRDVTVEVEVPDIDRGLSRLQAMSQSEGNDGDNGDEEESEQ